MTGRKHNSDLTINPKHAQFNKEYDILGLKKRIRPFQSRLSPNVAAHTICTLIFRIARE